MQIYKKIIIAVGIIAADGTYASNDNDNDNNAPPAVAVIANLSEERVKINQEIYKHNSDEINSIYKAVKKINAAMPITFTGEKKGAIQKAEIKLIRQATATTLAYTGWMHLDNQTKIAGLDTQLLRIINGNLSQLKEALNKYISEVKKSEQLEIIEINDLIKRHNI